MVFEVSEYFEYQPFIRRLSEVLKETFSKLNFAGGAPIETLLGEINAIAKK